MQYHLGSEINFVCWQEILGRLNKKYSALVGQQHSLQPTIVASTSHQEVSKDFKTKMSDQKSMTSRFMEISSSSPGRERAMATQAETLEWHKKRWGQSSSNPLLPPLPCPAFSSLAVMEDGLSEWIFTRESFTEDYVLLLFLPMDGSVDMAELEAFGEKLEQLERLGCQVSDHCIQILQNLNLTFGQTRWSLSQETVSDPSARFFLLVFKQLLV